jgi:hypothetical protein
MRVFLFALVAIASLACASAPKEKAIRLLPPTENNENTVTGAQNKDTHFAEVKKAASQQLDCPEDKINIVCLRRDAENECVSIRADGCDKSYEYQFGSES